VLRAPDAAMREIRRRSYGRKVLEMSDPNRISAAKIRHSESILSKIRANFGVEASSQSTHLCGAVKQRSKRCPMSLQTTLDAPFREIIRPSRQ